VTAQSLPELAASDPWVRKILDNAQIGHRTAARAINDTKGAGTTSEKSVRRYRRNPLSVAALTDPQPTSVRAPIRGGGGHWHTGIDIDPKEGGEFRTKPRVIDLENPGPEPEEAALLDEFGLDSALWEVTGSRKSQWQGGPGGSWLEARRVSFRPRVASPTMTVADVDAIMAGYAGKERMRAHTDTSPGRIMMVAVGDLQLGKSDGGGTAATVDRFCRITDDISDTLIDHVGPQVLILPWLGDCIEGIVSQRGRLVAALDITITEQVRVYRRLMMHQLAKYIGLAEKILIPVLPGNHDETTRDQVMPVHDSWAIEGASAVADWCAGRPGYEHVQFVFPDKGELGMTLDVGHPNTGQSYVISFHHGHSASSPAGIIPWWVKQSHGRQHAGLADLLVTAHFHHLRVEHTGGNRTWLQIPALDGGSDWYRHRAGEQGVTGMVSVEITPGVGQGWRGLTVHS
jgi:hypothetical protein